METRSNFRAALLSREVVARYLGARKDKVPGGRADKKDPKDFDPGQLAKGKKVEMEHTDDPDLALEIAMDHLTENAKYYDHLEEMESKFEKKE